MAESQEWNTLGYSVWEAGPPQPTGSGTQTKALVLGGGGATGIAWLGGLIGRLQELGTDLSDADTIIGTSAGSVVGTHLRLGTPPEQTTKKITHGEPLKNLGHFGRKEVGTLVRANLASNPVRGRVRLGGLSAAAKTGPEDEFVAVVAADLADAQWPAGRLLITAVDVDNGAAVVFTKDSGVPLDRAVASSCAVPGIFPPVTIKGRRYMDGGTRSVANVDLARGHDRVLVLAPIPMAMRRSNAPARQARLLREHSRTLVIAPDRETRRAVGVNFLDMKRTQMAYDAGRAQADLVADRVARVWGA